MEGEREAFYFSYKIKCPPSWIQQHSAVNEHEMFTVQRAFVLAMACIACYHDWLDTVLLAFACMGCFPFMHDGMYYLTRNKLDGIYPKKWFDQSETSTALTDKYGLVNPVPRTIYFVLSVGIVVYEIIKFWK
jgi:hypothetical protein